MSLNTRDEAADRVPIQDGNVINTVLDSEGDNWSGQQNNESVAFLGGTIAAMLKRDGEFGRRNGATKINGADIPLTGTLTAVATAVTGSGTAFETELFIGALIAGTAGQFREVQAIADNLNFTLLSAFSSDFAGQAGVRMRTTAERLDSLAVQEGFMDARSVKNATNPPTIKAGSLLDVNGKKVFFTTDQVLTFATNFGSPNSDINNWYYTITDNAGTLSTEIATGSSIVAAAAIDAITRPGGSTSRYDMSGAGIDLSGVVAGDLFVALGTASSVNKGIFPITAVNDGADTVDVLNSAGVAQGATGGTGQPFLPVGDVAGGGAGVQAFSPDPAFNVVNRNYESDHSGNRVLNIFFVEASNLVEDIWTYGTGRKKNDNYFEGSGTNGAVGGSPNALRVLTFERTRGADMTITDSATSGEGTRVTVNVPGMMQVSVVGATSSQSSSNQHLGLFINGTLFETIIRNVNGAPDFVDTDAGSMFLIPLNQGDIVQVARVAGTPDLEKWMVHFFPWGDL